MASKPEKSLIWDAPTRTFHWLLVLSFLTCYLTGEDDRWALLHVTGGFTVSLLILFRLIWGFFGSRHARFAAFVRGPRAVMDYLKQMIKGRPAHFAGHNPVGAVSILLLLILGIVVVSSGILIFEEVSLSYLEEIHEWSSHLMLMVVGIHVLGVAASSYLHQENLVKAMITGRKTGFSKESIRNPHRWVAILLSTLVACLWVVSYKEKLQGLL